MASNSCVSRMPPSAAFSRGRRTSTAAARLIWAEGAQAQGLAQQALPGQYGFVVGAWCESEGQVTAGGEGCQAGEAGEDLVELEYAQRVFVHVWILAAVGGTAVRETDLESYNPAVEY
jgi:hypothetical protein